MIKRSLSVVSLATILLAACRQAPAPSVEQVVFTVSGFQEEHENPTRTSLGEDGKRFVWAERDTVGIYPDTGAQVYFAMSAGAGTDNASFDGGGWSFLPTAVYYSYYPFIGDIYLDRHHIAVSYLGQYQPTATDIAHIGPYDFMCTDGTMAEGNVLHFVYSHLNCLIRVTATLPEGTYVQMTVTSPDADFTATGYYDLASNVREIISQTRTHQLCLDLGNIVSDGPTPLVFYLMSAPVDLKGKEITVRFQEQSGQVYAQTKTPSRAYAASTIGGLTCSDFVSQESFSHGVRSRDLSMGDDDEVLTINQ